ncbi:MAG TPA: hypothetical protein VKT49_25055 [Bryobacteraceae bacterium]|nr:hypothetical protein [Bryobacteraceae bacterium]
MSSPTVLVLDGELGFVFALSMELSKRHISVFPARTAREARSTITRFRLRPDTLVVNCSSPGACALAQDLATQHKGIRVVAITSARFQCKQCADRIAASLRDSEDASPLGIPHCADIIEALVKQSRQAGGS